MSGFREILEAALRIQDQGKRTAGKIPGRMTFIPEGPMPVQVPNAMKAIEAYEREPKPATKFEEEI